MRPPMRPLRVATYNIHSCIGGDRRFDPQRVLAVIREMEPDIIALQEIGGDAVNGLEQLDFFSSSLEMTAIPGLKRPDSVPRHGNAILVRGDVRRVNLVDLSVRGREPRSAIECDLAASGSSVRLITTHLGLSSAERRHQIERIHGLLHDAPEMPTVLLGDFNIFGRERRLLYGIGAPKPLPVLRSFPARRPLMSLDRIWTTPNAHLAWIELHRTRLSRMASDHLPLIAGIILKESHKDQPLQSGHMRTVPE